MVTPLISVVIPLYNKAKFVSETLESVLQQDYSNLEILVVNDASTDYSLEVIKTYSDSRIKIINNETNQGLSASRNIGIKKSKGDLIALLDADDTWAPHYLSIINALYQKFPNQVFYGTDFLEIFSKKGAFRTQKNINKTDNNAFVIVSDFFEASKSQAILCPSSMVINKKIASDHMFNKAVTYAEDVDFYIRFFTNNSLAYFNKPLVFKKANISNQITRLSISNRQIPNLNSLQEKYGIETESFLTYINNKRYMYAYRLKLEGSDFSFLSHHIDFNRLNTKQKIALKAPKLIMLVLNSMKQILLKLNIKFKTY